MGAAFEAKVYSLIHSYMLTRAQSSGTGGETAFVLAEIEAFATGLSQAIANEVHAEMVNQLSTTGGQLESLVSALSTCLTALSNLVPAPVPDGGTAIAAQIAAATPGTIEACALAETALANLQDNLDSY